MGGNLCLASHLFTFWAAAQPLRIPGRGRHSAGAYDLNACRSQVGLLDIDICGPSVPKMTGLEGEEIHQSGSGWSPVYVQPNLAVMSIGFLLTDPNDAVVWRGPRKSGLIKQFLKDVDWGSLDYLVRQRSLARADPACLRRPMSSPRRAGHGAPVLLPALRLCERKQARLVHSFAGGQFSSMCCAVIYHCEPCRGFPADPLQSAPIQVLLIYRSASSRSVSSVRDLAQPFRRTPDKPPVPHPATSLQIVDAPPGTSDEHISIVQYLAGSLKPDSDGAVVVTTPQEVSLIDVRKELSFCKKARCAQDFFLFAAQPPCTADALLSRAAARVSRDSSVSFRDTSQPVRVWKQPDCRWGSAAWGWSKT